MSVDMSITARLKRETEAAHRRVEALTDIKERIGCVHTYRALLARLYGFYAEWEPKLAAALGAHVFDGTRRKAGLLRRDLHALGYRRGEVDRLPLCPCPIGKEEFTRALGSMYVLEGATLGGAVIARMVERRLDLDIKSGCAFFRGYGRATAEMWRGFQATLLAESTPSLEDEIVASAAATFDAFGAWISQPQPRADA
jgi:heme oxygenase